MFRKALLARKSSQPCHGVRAAALSSSLMFAWFLAPPAIAQFGQSRRAEIHVRVTEFHAESPINQVKLELVKFPSGVLKSLFTDSAGGADFSDITPDDYILRASKDGYLTSEVRVEVSLHQAVVEAPVRLERVKREQASATEGLTSLRRVSLPEKAVKELEKGLELLDEKKDAKASLKHFQKAIAIVPDYYEAYFLMGMAYTQTNSPGDAEGALRTSIKLNSKFLLPYYPLSILLFRQRRYEEEQQLLQQAMDLDQGGWKWPFELARCLAKRGEWDKAIEYGLMAVQKTNAPSKVHLLMGDLYSNVGSTNKAIAEFERFAEIDPDSPFIPKVQQALSTLRGQAPNSRASGPQP